MTLDGFKREISNWKFTKQKAIYFAIGMIALLFYEFVARPYYRPYIYRNNINDFHIADTLGNSVGTIATIFGFLFLLVGWEEKDKSVDFKLVKVTPNKVYFDGLTFERVSKNELNVYVVIAEGEEKSEVTFNYKRVK